MVEADDWREWFMWRETRDVGSEGSVGPDSERRRCQRKRRHVESTPPELAMAKDFVYEMPENIV